MKTVAFNTLGCKLNFSETSTIANLFLDNNYSRVAFNNKADIYIINTCSVTANADRKCRQIIRKAVKNNANAIVVVIGCYAQLKPKEISEIKGVNVVLGANEKFNILKYIKDLDNKQAPKVISCDVNDVDNFFPAFSFGDRTRSFLKVQDGCDYECTYCTIPLARGKSRNDTVENTVNQAKKIAEKEVKEIILTGVNIGDFGQSTGESFTSLVKELDKVEGIERYRISSIEPNLITDEIINIVSSSKRFVPHFHIPLQSGTDTLLAKMKRRYNTELYKNKIETINKLIPEASIGVDVIIGFPGETDEDFNTTYNFLNSLDISYLHVFTYSDRENTLSNNMDNKVNPKVKDERSKMLHILSDKLQRRFYEKNLGQEKEVLFETQKKNGKMFGFTDNYVKVELDFDKNLVNNITKVQLLSINEDGNVNAIIVS